MIVTLDIRPPSHPIDFCIYVFVGDVVVGKAHGTTHDKALRAERRIRDFLREDYG